MPFPTSTLMELVVMGPTRGPKAPGPQNPLPVPLPRGAFSQGLKHPRFLWVFSHLSM